MRPRSFPSNPIRSAARWVWPFALFCLLAGCATAPPRVGPVPEPLRAGFHLDPFYRQCVTVGPLPIVGSERVSPHALREAAWIVGHLLEGRDDILAALAASHTRLAIMAWNEFTTDIPEHRNLTPRVFWDRRARGLGATPDAPAVSGAEENLLAYPGDPYPTENILIHEFAHAIHIMAMPRVDPTFASRLDAAFQDASRRGLWKGTYAGTNAEEYWAEAVQDWFDDNRENDGLHNHVNTRAELVAYDPAVARLCAEVFGDRPWRYHRPAFRSPAERAHLAGFDPATSPRFQWRPEPVPDRPRVLIQTKAGDFELELDTRAAPVTTANFLRYVHEGWYADGRFFRTVREGNQPTNLVKIAVVQAQANPARTNLFPQPILLERTRDTGLRHRDGTVSMARADPDSAQDHFFICIGDQPELDFGGRRNPDGQGFAAFGAVVRGMEVVRRIHTAPAEGQLLQPPVVIQRAIRLN